MSFGADISRYAKKTGLSIEHSIISICTEASVSIIERTPVDSGTARGNWYATINAESSDTDDNRREKSALSDARNKAQKAAGNIFILTNNLPYIRRLEYGWSTQAPQGMVRITAAKVNEALKRI